MQFLQEVKPDSKHWLCLNGMLSNHPFGPVQMFLSSFRIMCSMLHFMHSVLTNSILLAGNLHQHRAAQRLPENLRRKPVQQAILLPKDQQAMQQTLSPGRSSLRRADMVSMWPSNAQSPFLKKCMAAQFEAALSMLGKSTCISACDLNIALVHQVHHSDP